MRLEFHPVDRRNPKSLMFDSHRQGTISSAGMVARVFELIGATNKVCIEIGAADGKWLSNTYALINDGGWTGILIEGSKKSFGELQATYAGCPRATLVNRYADLGANSLDSILTEVACPVEPDFLSLDIDGIDWWIWRSLSLHQPRVILVEFNQAIPNDVLFVPDPDKRQGCSLSALVELGHDKGYELAATTDRDGLFVRSELFSLLNIADNSIDTLHHLGQNETKAFPLLDGSVLLVGNDKVFWGGGSIIVGVRRTWRQRWRSIQRFIRKAIRFQFGS
jgi:hypothetical protein